jgi:phosphoglycolate phosphatase
MRYDLVVFPLDVLDMLSTDSGTSEVLQELTDLGSTLGLVSDTPEAMARAALGRKQHLFDAYECTRTASGTETKLRRIGRRLAVPCDRILLVTTSLEDIEAASRFGASSAVPGWLIPHQKTLAAVRSMHVISELADLLAIVSNRPVLRLVRQVSE